MIIKLPQVDTPINLGAPPENLEDIVCESFSKYTEGTREKYTFADKLAYIDMLRDWLHPKSSDDVVRDMFRDYFDYQLDENGDIPDHEDYWSMDFFYKQLKEILLEGETFIHVCTGSEKLRYLVTDVVAITRNEIKIFNAQKMARKWALEKTGVLPTEAKY